MLYEAMCLVGAALASLGWFVAVNEAEKMFECAVVILDPALFLFGSAPLRLETRIEV